MVDSRYLNVIEGKKSRCLETVITLSAWNWDVVLIDGSTWNINITTHSNDVDDNGITLSKER